LKRRRSKGPLLKDAGAWADWVAAWEAVDAGAAGWGAAAGAEGEWEEDAAAMAASRRRSR
jgi:hypothetical protein